MLLFYITYAILLLILTPFIATGKGLAGFIFYFILSMSLPVVGPMIWAWLWSPGDRAQNLRITIMLQHRCGLHRHGLAILRGVAFCPFSFNCLLLYWRYKKPA